MFSATLDDAPLKAFDAGRFVARYFQVLACLSVASMIAQAIFSDSLNFDASPIFLFWAASALKRRSQTARLCVLAFASFGICLVVFMLLFAVMRGTDGMTVSFGIGHIKNPSLWQLAVGCFSTIVVMGIPVGVLMSKRARRQFNGVWLRRNANNPNERLSHW